MTPEEHTAIQDRLAKAGQIREHIQKLGRKKLEIGNAQSFTVSKDVIAWSHVHTTGNDDVLVTQEDRKTRREDIRTWLLTKYTAKILELQKEYDAL